MSRNVLLVGLAAWSARHPIEGSIIKRCLQCGVPVLVSSRLLEDVGEKKADVWCHICFVKSKTARNSKVMIHEVTEEELEDLGMSESQIKTMFEAFMEVAKRGLH